MQNNASAITPISTEEVTRRAKKPRDEGPLSARELEVLSLMVTGMTNTEIGKSLGISVKTVEAHRDRMFRKLGAKNAPHAVIMAIRAGYVQV